MCSTLLAAIFSAATFCSNPAVFQIEAFSSDAPQSALQASADVKQDQTTTAFAASSTTSLLSADNAPNRLETGFSGTARSIASQVDSFEFDIEAKHLAGFTMKEDASPTGPSQTYMEPIVIARKAVATANIAIGQSATLISEEIKPATGSRPAQFYKVVATRIR